jgi:hypothetical protein
LNTKKLLNVVLLVPLNPVSNPKLPLIGLDTAVPNINSS